VPSRPLDDHSLGEHPRFLALALVALQPLAF